MHVTMVLRVVRIFARRVELVNLGLQARICVGMCEEEEEQGRHRARCRVRTCYDDETAIVGELTHRDRRSSLLVLNIFVILRKR